ncbi:DUF3800 domain-containing protein [Priestia megaterium]|uniref:DUF3800 domain-containing protein n=1 Tax=Priestia megaterium TaxID=1404 RepID=UPI00300A6D8F
MNICNFLDSMNQKDLSEKLRGGIKYLEDNLESEKKSHESLPNKTMMSLNVPTYIAYINLLEKVGRRVNGSFTLIHDKTKQFEESYHELFSLYSSVSKNYEFPLTDGNSILLGFNQLKKFSFADSKENEWIQASDILASVLGRVLKTIYHNESFNEELFNLAKSVLPLLLVKEMKLAESICSDKMRTKIFRAMVYK